MPANAMGVGAYKTDTLKEHDHAINNATGSYTDRIAQTNSGGGGNGPGLPTARTYATGSAETAPEHIRVSPVVYV